MLQFRAPCVFPFSAALTSSASSFVPLTRLYVLGASFFSAVLCHDQFTARHMTASSASEDLKDFVRNPGLPGFSPSLSLSDVQNGHLYSHPTVEGDCGLWFLLTRGYWRKRERQPWHLKRYIIGQISKTEIWPFSDENVCLVGIAFTWKLIFLNISVMRYVLLDIYRGIG